MNGNFQQQPSRSECLTIKSEAMFKGLREHSERVLGVSHMKSVLPKGYNVLRPVSMELKATYSPPVPAPDGRGCDVLRGTVGKAIRCMRSHESHS